MHSLKPFNHTSINSNLELSLTAEVTRQDTFIHINYHIIDSKNHLHWPENFLANANLIPREDGLWNDTCFEIFLRPKGQTSYYEFNFSLKPAWNLYHFVSYRSPQPPTPCYDFSLESFQWDGSNLMIKIGGLTTQQIFEISLTAVLKDKTENIHYFALKHAGLEPDFHHQESFVLIK